MNTDCRTPGPQGRANPRRRCRNLVDREAGAFTGTLAPVVALLLERNLSNDEIALESGIKRDTVKIKPYHILVGNRFKNSYGL